MLVKEYISFVIDNRIEEHMRNWEKCCRGKSIEGMGLHSAVIAELNDLKTALDLQSSSRSQCFVLGFKAWKNQVCQEVSTGEVADNE